MHMMINKTTADGYQKPLPRKRWKNEKMFNNDGNVNNGYEAEIQS